MRTMNALGGSNWRHHFENPRARHSRQVVKLSNFDRIFCGQY
jgi:hypothetical protein